MDAHNGTMFDISFLFSNMEYYNDISNLIFFHLDTLTLAKSVFSKIPLPPKLKNKIIYEFLAGHSVDDRGLESQQAISDVHTITVVLNYYILYSNRDQDKNPIETY